MSTHESLPRPPIHLIDTEADVLSHLASQVEERTPELTAMLIGEIERATVHAAGRIPKDVVTMNATVDFVDESNGTLRSVQLVYPKDADIAAGRISILTPVGAGLIGMREGGSIAWPDRDGHVRNLTVVRVAQAATGA